MSLRRLGLEQIPLWQLHRVDPAVPEDEQFGALAELQSEGKIRHLGLSEVDVTQIKRAQRHFTVATVQNLYNLTTRRYEEVVDHCEAEGIGFIPWYPIATGDLARPGGPLDTTLLASLYQMDPGAYAELMELFVETAPRHLAPFRDHGITIVLAIAIP